MRGERFSRAFLFFSAFLFLPAAVAAEQRHTSEIGSHLLTTDIEWQGPRRLLMRARMILPEPAWKVWRVLTDYDRLESFIPCLKESVVLARRGRGLTLYQEGSVWMPFFQCRTQATMQVREREGESIRFRTLRGGDFVIYQGRWLLKPVPQGVRLTYEAVVEPDFWVPRWALAGLNRQILKGTFESVLERCREIEAPSLPLSVASSS